MGWGEKTNHSQQEHPVEDGFISYTNPSSSMPPGRPQHSDVTLGPGHPSYGSQGITTSPNLLRHDDLAREPQARSSLEAPPKQHHPDYRVPAARNSSTPSRHDHLEYKLPAARNVGRVRPGENPSSGSASTILNSVASMGGRGSPAQDVESGIRYGSDLDNLSVMTGYTLLDDTSISPAREFELGESVCIQHHWSMSGIIRYVGGMSAKPGTWIGVELEHPDGDNDGTVNGHPYFTCGDRHGIFVPPEKVMRDSESSGTVPGARVWIGAPYRESGVVHYVGHTCLGEGIWMGIELDWPHGAHDGSVDGRKYFTCRPKHGILIRPDRLGSIEDDPKLRTTEMCSCFASLMFALLCMVGANISMTAKTFAELVGITAVGAWIGRESFRRKVHNYIRKVMPIELVAALAGGVAGALMAWLCIELF